MGLHPLTALSLALASLLLGGRAVQADVPRHTATFFSKPYVVDQIYRSMKGPGGAKAVSLTRTERPELLWITGYRAEIVSADGGAPLSPEFMCHSNLDFIDPADHHERLHPESLGLQSRRLFTLSQGMMDVSLPAGFGVPVFSDEQLRLGTQVLNLNPQPAPVDVQHRTSIEYVRARDLVVPMKPLYQKGVQALVLVEGQDGFYGEAEANPEEHGEGCSLGEPAGQKLVNDEFGRTFAAHWVVEPGREVRHTPVTRMLDLEFDTTVHYIAVHLHPFAESLELRDRTAGKTVFKSLARGASGRVGLEDVEAYSSAEGLPVYKDHEYELISIYDNTSGREQDAMAVMLIFMLDPNYRSPLPTRSVAPVSGGEG